MNHRGIPDEALWAEGAALIVSARRSSLPSRGRSGAPIPSVEKEVAEHHGLIVPFVARGIEQRDRPAAEQVVQRRKRSLVGSQLGPIPFLKHSPAIRGMPEPLAELRARRGILAPQRQIGSRLAHATRPQAIHQDPKAVIRFGRWRVDPLESDDGQSRHCRLGRCHAGVWSRGG